MGLLDGLEKLITEHGSATVLKERIELANDKYAALEAKAGALLSENSALKRELELLKEKLAGLEGAKEKRQDSRLEETKEKLLLLLAQREETPEGSIARLAGMNPQVAAFHIQELSDAGLLDCSAIMNEGLRWYLSQEGRRYLIKNGLIK